MITSKHGINKPKKPGSIEGSPNTQHQKLDFYVQQVETGRPQNL
jgi:hypothetical protein